MEWGEGRLWHPRHTRVGPQQWSHRLDGTAKVLSLSVFGRSALPVSLDGRDSSPECVVACDLQSASR